MLNSIRKCKPKSPLESIIIITLFNAGYNSIVENYSIAICNYFICFLCFGTKFIIIVEKRFSFSQVWTLECIIYIHFLQQLIFYGIGSSWMTYYFLPFLKHQEQLRMLILISILIQCSLQFDGYQTSTFIQNIVNCLIILVGQFFKLNTHDSLIEQAKGCIEKYYTSQIVIKIFDKNLQDLTVFENIDSEVGNAYTPITSDRVSSTAVVPFRRKDLTYKIYYNNAEQIFLSTEIISQQFQVMVFKDTKSLLQGYLSLKQEKKISLILAIETDYKRKKKIKHHLIILEFKPNYFCLAFQVVNDGLIQKYSNSVALFKSNLQSIFTHKLKTPLNAALGYLQVANFELQQHNLAPSICNQIHYAYLNSRLQLYFVQDLLDFTSQNSDQIILQINKLNLKLLLKNIHDIVEYQCQAKGISLKFTINNIDWKKEERIYHIQTDQLKLERVLYNILNNSYRYTNAGGILELNLCPDEFNNNYTFDIIDNTKMNDEEIESYNTQLALQNQFYYIGKSIQKQSKYKLGLTMKITNKLIYLMSDKTSYLSIKKLSEKQHCFSFSIQSIINQSCNQSGDPNRLSIQQRSKLQSGVISQSNISQKQQMLHQSFDEVSEEPYPSKPIITSSLNRTLYIQRLDHQIKLDQSQNSLFQSIQGNYKLQQSTDLIRKSNRIRLSDIILHANQRNFIAESIDIKGDQDAVIMTVDDEPFNHDILTLMLKPLGFHKFVRAHNGQQCVEIIEKGDNQIKVIFMDLDMPVMGGIQATKILNQLMSNEKIPFIPIIGCTAHDDKQTHEECYQAGMIHVVVKPVFNKALQEAFIKVNQAYQGFSQSIGSSKKGIQ